jgi:hypothetical protein
VTGQWFSPGTPVSFTNKTDGHNITEILLKVALNTINQTYIYVNFFLLYPCSPKGEGGILFYLCLPSIQDIFRRIFLSNCWWQKSDIWSYRYTILWVAFLDPSDSYFLFAKLVGFYTHWTYMHNTFFVTFFSATIDGRNLIFGTPYRGKRFWTHQIPSSCLPTLLIFIHIEQWSGKSRAMHNLRICNWNGTLNLLSDVPSGALFSYRKS